MAYKTLLALHIESLPVDPLQILSFCNNTVSHSYEDMMARVGEYDYFSFKQYYMEGKDALTIRRTLDNGKCIYECYYANRGNPFRRRFTLAHELGHIILKHSMEEIWEEREADYFASQLLAPHPILQLLRENNLCTPEYVADMFCLSKSAATIAVNQPNHTPDADIYGQIVKQFSDYLTVKSLYSA